MSTFSSAMMALAGPLAKKVLSSIGIGFVTFTGVNEAVQAGLSAAKSAFGGVPADVLSILAMAGFFTAASVIAGGITAGLTMMAFSRLGKVV